MIRYGQVVKTVNPISEFIRTHYDILITKLERKYIINKNDPNNLSHRVTIPIGTLCVLKFVHIDGTHAQCVVTVPVPRSHDKLFGTFLCKMEDLNFKTTKWEKNRMAPFVTRFLCSKSSDNLKTMQALDAILK